jgi:hypothetical protein
VEHGKSLLLGNDDCSFSIEPVISTLFVLHCRQPRGAIWCNQNHPRLSYCKRVLGVLAGASPDGNDMS